MSTDHPWMRLKVRYRKLRVHGWAVRDLVEVTGTGPTGPLMKLVSLGLIHWLHFRSHISDLRIINSAAIYQL